jgi:hypothetical protein
MTKRLVLSITVVVALAAAAVGGAFAGFVDTEVSQGNFVQAGMSDLLINGKNDPIGAKLQFIHAAPCKSIDFWIDAYNWGVCQGGDLYMHFKDVVSEEDGRKPHMGVEYVYDAVTPSTVPGVPDGYREADGDEPFGPGVWSTEPEKISEVGDGYIAQYYISDADPNLLGEDYASGVSEHLDILVEVCDDGNDGILDDADDNGDGEVDSQEYAAHDWTVIPSLSGKLVNIECNKNWLGFLATQAKTWIHVDVHLQQIYAEEWFDENGIRWDVGGSTAVGVDYDGDGDIDGDDFQKAGWPTNALQGDKASWDMLFELITDP